VVERGGSGGGGRYFPMSGPCPSANNVSVRILVGLPDNLWLIVVCRILGVDVANYTRCFIILCIKCCKCCDKSKI